MFAKSIYRRLVRSSKTQLLGRCCFSKWSDQNEMSNDFSKVTRIADGSSSFLSYGTDQSDTWVRTPESTIISGFGGRVVTTSDYNYNFCKYQYATTSYDSSDVSPAVIAYVSKDDDHTDIKLALNYGRQNNMSVVVRSGGCQYSGLSAGNGSDLVIDMSDYNDISIDGTLVTIEPTNRLGTVGTFLDDNNVALPFGDCAVVNIGGHVQTGGFGNLLRGFGLCLDYCIGFQVIKSDGTVQTVTKPSESDAQTYDVWNVTSSSDENSNYDMYWAVMGGNPQSFGIVTKYYFDCIKNEDHSSSAGMKFTALYDKNVLKSMVKQFEVLFASAQDGTLPSDYDFMLTVASSSDLEGVGFIIFEGTYSNVDGEYASSWFDTFKTTDDIVILSTAFDGTKSVSSMMKNFILLKTNNREYDLPYYKTLRGATSAWNTLFPDSYVENIDNILTLQAEKEKGNAFRVISQLQLGGGACASNDSNSTYTAIANRDCIVGFSFDIFYDTEKDSDAQEVAKALQEDMQSTWVGDNGLFSKEDIRFTWGTFDSTDIEDVYPYYYSPDADSRYSVLQRIKSEFDSENVFNTEFTIPPQS